MSEKPLVIGSRTLEVLAEARRDLEEAAFGTADGPSTSEPDFLPRYPQAGPFYLSNSRMAVIRVLDNKEVARCTSLEAAKAAFSLLNG